MIRALTQQPPIQFGIGAPFVALAKFAPHEEQLLARKEPLITEQSSQIGELLPIVTGHAAEERSFAVYHFVMRERQNEILVVVVEHGKSKIILMILPVNGVAGEEPEGIVHPAHVPFEGKAKAAEIRRACDERPRRGFLSNRDHPLMFGVDQMIKM